MTVEVGLPVEITHGYRLGVLIVARDGLESGRWSTDDVMRALKRLQWLDIARAVSDVCLEAAEAGR